MDDDDPEAGTIPVADVPGGDPEDARLAFRRVQPGPTLEGIDEPLGLRDDSGRDGVLYVPDTAEKGAPLLVFLHGATGTGRSHMRAVLAAADRYGVVVVAPDSRGPTWDIIYQRRFGPDVAFIDRMLPVVTSRIAVDPDRVAIGGVSDGASYALSIGMTNGDVFPSVIAYSPGFLVTGSLHGEPRVFVSHGTEDQILPIDMCGRRVVQQLDHAGYDVSYLEFDGGHNVPPPVADRSIVWWLENK